MAETVDAMVLAARGVEIERRFKVADLPRLRELSIGDDSLANLHARFHAVDGRCGVNGEVTATLHATCQRCLQPVRLNIDDRFHVIVVGSEEEMSELPQTQDSVIANAEHLDLAWLTEEQVLLALPLVPLHATTDECSARARKLPESPNDRQVPFARLRELMKQQ